ncbi:MAG: FAD-binding oxidoreductase [Flavobacteriales bacterium]|nr:FAD-binding oxidoreductase [Flavobacteriales bacterium]
MSYHPDVILLGHGIAGAVLAETLLARGLRVHVYDRKLPGNASMAAAGVVNPLVLKRETPSWRAQELLPMAEACYRKMEQRLGAHLWHPMELVRLFPDEATAQRWDLAMRDPITSSFIDRREQPAVEAAPLRPCHGYGTAHRAAWLDVPAMLELQRRDLLKRGAFTESEISDADIEVHGTGIRVAGMDAQWLVRCTGAFKAMPGMVPVKGEGLTVRLSGLRMDRMLHRGVFLLPQGGEVYRAGATFQWDDVWSGPTDAAREGLLRKIDTMTPAPAQVLDHWSGVRPTSRDRRPIMGRTSAHEAVLNGLGSRGVLLAPWCADHLAGHLLDGAPLDPEVDVVRFTA